MPQPSPAKGPPPARTGASPPPTPANQTTTWANAGAGEALGALYDVVAETPALAWLLEPQGETLQRAFVIGAWLVPLAVDVRAEVLRKRIIEGEAADVNDAGGDGGFAAAPSTANGARRHGTTATPPADRRAHDAAL